VFGHGGRRIIGNGVILRKLNFPWKISVQWVQTGTKALPDGGASVDNGFFASDA
jgi:hypothetical protein